MSIQTILFDLDGTLLPMDQDKFTDGYFRLLTQKLAPHGYDPKALISAIWQSVGAMIKNDGSCTNEEAFWHTFTALLGPRALSDRPVIEAFYRNEFQQARALCGFNPEAAQTVAWLSAQGYGLALATNPLFPATATESRIRWAGLTPGDFGLYTTYENCHFCKPNPDYYREVLVALHLSPQDCLMVGNDVDEDMVTETLGMSVFLLTDCLINRSGRDISRYPQGSFAQLRKYLSENNTPAFA